MISKNIINEKGKKIYTFCTKLPLNFLVAAIIKMRRVINSNVKCNSKDTFPPISRISPSKKHKYFNLHPNSRALILSIWNSTAQETAIRPSQDIDIALPL
jgi:hypothetical protein